MPRQRRRHPAGAAVGGWATGSAPAAAYFEVTSGFFVIRKHGHSSSYHMHFSPKFVSQAASRQETRPGPLTGMITGTRRWRLQQQQHQSLRAAADCNKIMLLQPVLLPLLAFLCGQHAVTPASAGPAETPSAPLSADLAIYGSTVCGVTAAVGASRTNPNATVVLLVNSTRLGGMTSGGLGGRDAQKMLPLGGLAGDLWAPLCSQAAGGGCGFEPHAAEASVQSLLSTAPNVIVRRDTGWLKTVESAGSYPRQIRSITTQSGLTVQARQWIDCSYEGDLLRLSGTDFAVGREARSEYNESAAGVDGQTHPQVGVDQTPSMFADDVSPWTDASNTTLLPGIVGLQNYSDAQAGEADDWVQSFCFRLCLTTRQNNSLPMLPPSDYTPEVMELLRRQILSDTKRGMRLHMRDTTVDGKMQRGMFLVRDLPNDKIDLNSGAFSDSPFSTDLPFLQHGWPLGGPQERYVFPPARF